MRAILVLMGVCELWAASAVNNGTRYAFYRSMGGGVGSGAGSRRVFGGDSAPLEEWGAVCALLDRYWTPRCSAAVVAPRWALTAAHCITPRVAYVKYNTRHPSAADGQVAPVHYLYRHPGYQVVQQDEGRGMDVTLLHHDVGLVRTRADMLLAAPPPRAAVAAMQLYDPLDLDDKEIQVLGFGRTEAGAQGEQLFSARLVAGRCGRAGWQHCLCGAAPRGAPQAGVCSGDSGGPVLFRGAQVAVTSMGPVECGSGGLQQPAAPATSVFTALRRYASLVNATINDADAALQMARLSRAHLPSLHTSQLALLLLLLCQV